MEFGIYTFGDNMSDPTTGSRISPVERVRNLLEEIQLADQVGLDVFGLGEHHRPDYLISGPDLILAAAAARTKNIRLTSAVTVLSSDDPVRVFQRFSTLDLVSNGRAEIMAGRGSFIESFPLFGFDLGDYDTLFSENLELLLRLRDGERVSWQGGHRAAIHDLGVYPRPLQDPLPVWIAVGGTPQSVVRAAVLGLPLAIAIIGGNPAHFQPLVELYHRAAKEAGSNPANLRVGINSHGFIAENSQDAADIAYPPFAAVMTKLGQERGWPPMTRGQFEAQRRLHGALFVGSPSEVAEKILYQHELFNHDRFLIQFSVGTLPHDKMMKSIELFGTKVVPEVRKALAAKADAVAPTLG